MIHLDHRDSRPIYVQIADALRRQIDCGILSPGDKLPSVRELSARLTINPNTIQRAYRELEQDGVIRSEPGRGSFVAPQQQNKDWQEFDEAVRSLLRQGRSPAQIIQRIREVHTND